MKKPFIIFRQQKSIAAIIISAAILVVGIVIVFNEKENNDSISVFAGQEETSAPNETITDLLGRLMKN